MTLRLLITTALCISLAACATSEGTPTRGTEAFTQAERSKRNGDLVTAAQGFSSIYARDKNAVDAAVELAAIERKLGNPQASIEIMKDIHSRYPDSSAVQMQLGYAYIDTGNTEAAVKLFDGMLVNEPKNILAYSGKAVAFDKAGNHLAAQDIYLKALAIEPESLTLKNNLGMSLILNNEPAEAIALLQPVVDTGKANTTVRQNLALAYGVIGNTEKAMEMNQKDLSPEQARENLRFYEKFMRQHRLRRDKQMQQVGFSDTTPAVKAKVAAKLDAKAKAKAAKAAEAEMEALEMLESAKPAEAPKPEAPLPSPAKLIKKEAPEPTAPEATTSSGGSAILSTGNGIGKTELRTKAQ